jgi:hypothetical protein
MQAVKEQREDDYEQNHLEPHTKLTFLSQSTINLAVFMKICGRIPKLADMLA